MKPAGVPQGSILDPLLFLYYVNDMSISINSDCQLLLYADDSTIMFSCQTRCDTVSTFISHYSIHNTLLGQKRKHIIFSIGLLLTYVRHKGWHYSMYSFDIYK